jgi:hypothetical protein
MSRADPSVSDSDPASGGRPAVADSRVRLRRLPTRMNSGACNGIAGWLPSFVTLLLMAKMKPGSVRSEVGHHTPGWASVGHGFS